MTTQEIRTHIRLAVHSLGRDHSDIDFPKNKTELVSMLSRLRREQREVGGILKTDRAFFIDERI